MMSDILGHFLTSQASLITYSDFWVILDLPTHPKIILITWQLTMTGQLMLVPMRAVEMASKSPSRREAELHTL